VGSPTDGLDIGRETLRSQQPWRIRFHSSFREPLRTNPSLPDNI